MKIVRKCLLCGDDLSITIEKDAELHFDKLVKGGETNLFGQPIRQIHIHENGSQGHIQVIGMVK